MTEKFGLLGKSFRDIKKDFSNGLGIGKSLFQKSISQSDLQALKNFDSAIKSTDDSLTKSQRITKAWNENMNGCSMAAKRVGNNLITGKQTINDISNSMKTATISTKALGTAMSVLSNVGFILVITAITKVVTEFAQAQTKAVEYAQEATKSYNDEINSISDYKSRLSELHNELNSGNLSYEETKSKRKELMAIQDELIEKFGTEKSAIQSVTEAINGQVESLDTLNEKAYRDWLAKADEVTGWNVTGQSGLDQAIGYMETDRLSVIYDMQDANLSDELREIQKEIDETIQSKYGLEKEFATFKITGTPEEVKKQLESIRQDYIDLSKKAFEDASIPSNMWEEYRKESIDSINKAILKIEDGLAKHQETYKTYIEGMIKYDSEYSDEYATILQKRADLEVAESSGNKEEILKARQNFMDAIKDAILKSGDNENIRKYFESLYPELQSEFSSWDFEFKLSANEDGIGDIAKKIGEKYTAADLLNMANTEGEESFNILTEKANEYGIKVEELIDLLVKLGYVQGEISTQPQESPFTLNIQQTIDSMKTKLLPAFDSLKSSYQNIFTEDGFTLENVDLTMLDDIQSALDEMADPKGLNLKVDYSSFEHLVNVLTNVEPAEEQVHSAFDSLATSILGSTTTIKDMDESTANLVASMLESMGVANANEVVFGTLQARMEAYALQEEIAANEAIAMSHGIEFSITSFLNQAGASEAARNALFALVTAEQVFNSTTLDISGKVASLKQLATAYGQTAVAARIAFLEQRVQWGETVDFNAELGNIQADINNAVNKVDVDFSSLDKSGAKSAGSAGAGAADAYLEAFEEEIGELDDLKNQGKISEKQYLDGLRSLYQKYFRDKEKYAKEYAKYESEYLDGKGYAIFYSNVE